MSDTKRAKKMIKDIKECPWKWYYRDGELISLSDGTVIKDGRINGEEFNKFWTLAIDMAVNEWRRDYDD